MTQNNQVRFPGVLYLSLSFPSISILVCFFYLFYVSFYLLYYIQGLTNIPQETVHSESNNHGINAYRTGLCACRLVLICYKHCLLICLLCTNRTAPICSLAHSPTPELLQKKFLFIKRTNQFHRVSTHCAALNNVEALKKIGSLSEVFPLFRQNQKSLKQGTLSMPFGSYWSWLTITARSVNIQLSTHHHPCSFHDFFNSITIFAVI